MFNHCLVSLTITVVITVINNEAFILQCQNCRCIPDYCQQTIPRSLCPCDGVQTRCGQATTGIQTVFTGVSNVHQQQPFVLPQNIKYFVIQQPFQQPLPGQITGQLVIGSQQQQQLIQALSSLQQQQFIQALSSLQQQISPQQVGIGGVQQPNLSPIYIIRTIEQPGQVFRPVQQIPEVVVSSQYASAIQQIPGQQTQIMVIPSIQQLIPQTQQFILPSQVPTQTVTLQVPVTMVEHCIPRKNACPVGLPSVHAVTECENATDGTGTRCITAEEARRLYTCLPEFDFNKLWSN